LFAAPVSTSGKRPGQMVTLLAEYGIKSNLEKEDYLKGLEHLKKVW